MKSRAFLFVCEIAGLALQPSDMLLVAAFLEEG